MKTAVVIDPEKIRHLKKQIAKKDYVDYAVAQLAYEISLLFK